MHLHKIRDTSDSANQTDDFYFPTHRICGELAEKGSLKPQRVSQSRVFARLLLHPRMADLPPLLIEALSAIGPETEARMGDLISDFVALPLGEEDRLSALAGAVATIATTRYSHHRAIFIAALRCWALEISVSLSPTPPRTAFESRRGPVEEAQDALLGGLDALLRAMADDGSAKHHRLVTELAVMAQLLGRYDAHSIHLVLTAASLACEDPRWRSGYTVPVLLSDGAQLLTRDACLASLAPRGTA
jgi:hypothetical protein